MASPTTTLIRRIVLFGNGLTFLLIAIAVLFAVDKVAYIYGYTLNGIGGHNDSVFHRDLENQAAASRRPGTAHGTATVDGTAPELCH
jgi:hypothetical protein